MRRSSQIVVASLATLAFSGAALADGMAPPPRPRAAPVRAAPPPPVQQQVNWTGGQFGGHGGGSQLGQSFAEPGSNLCPPSGGVSPGGLSVDYSGCRENVFGFSGHPTSATFGALLGYRWQLGNFVVGVEGDASWKRASTSASQYVQSTVTPFGGGFNHTRTETFTGKQTQGWDGSFRVRAGMLLTPTMLAYATGGLAAGELCGSYSYHATLAGPTNAAAQGSASWCDTRAGYTVGGGLEVALMQGWKARIEYRFTDLGSYSKDIPLVANAGAPCAPGFNCYGNARVDLNDNYFHTIRLGIGFDF